MEEPTSGQIIACLRAEFPKFSKVTLCMVRNPAYGCALSDAAAKRIKDTYPDAKIAQNRSSCVKPAKKRNVANRKKAHHLTLRLDDEAYAKFQAALKSESAVSTQQFLERVLEDYYER